MTKKKTKIAQEQIASFRKLKKEYILSLFCKAMKQIQIHIHGNFTRPKSHLSASRPERPKKEKLPKIYVFIIY